MGQELPHRITANSISLGKAFRSLVCSSLYCIFPSLALGLYRSQDPKSLGSPALKGPGHSRCFRESKVVPEW